MGQPRIKWAQVERYFLRHNYQIETRSSGDKFIIAPRTTDIKRTRNTVRIGHKCCNHAGDELFDCYLSAFRHAFGVTRQDILDF